MLTVIRFFWNATRGHRLQPWKSEFIRWRVETYSGLHADEIDGRALLRFLVRERGRLLHFLLWTSKVDRTTKV